MKPNIEMFQNAANQIEEFNKNFKLIETEAKQERKRVYWKDIIEQEE